MPNAQKEPTLSDVVTILSEKIATNQDELSRKLESQKNDILKVILQIHKRLDQHDQKFIDLEDNILNSVKKFADETTENFLKVDAKFDQIDKRFEKVENDLMHVKNQMVTKPYLDDKLANLTGAINPRFKKQDEKIHATVRLLAEKKVFSAVEAKGVLA